jgi:tetratricopeptide (TPR) repeat protein
MKYFLTILTAVFFTVSLGHSDVCSDTKKKALDVKKECQKLKKGTNEFAKCAGQFEVLKTRVNVVCGSGASDKEGIKKNIEQWHNLVKQCKGKSNTRCASALQQLGHFTYKYEEIVHLEASSQYEEDVAWCDDRDNKPEKCKGLKLPEKDHSKSLKFFEAYIDKYPKGSNTPSVLYQTSFIYELAQQEEKAFKLRQRLVSEYPDHGLVPKAWLRIGEYHFMERKFKEAIEAYKKVTDIDNLAGKEAALAMYHMAEAYYNRAEYLEAATNYFKYINGADNGKYPADLRPEAMDFMAASFADMEDGVIEAGKFLKGKNVKFNDSLYYRIGMKNKDHDRNPEAVQAFRYLLDINPTYIDAPLADMAMVSILLLQQKPEEAQKERLRIIKAYDKSSPWYRKNQQYTESVKNAEQALRGAMLDIPQYHHARGADLKKKGDIEAAKKEYALASKAYNDFLRAYPDPSWDEYKVHINMAVIYGDLGQHAKAAAEFNWVSDADTLKYGRRPQFYGELLKKEEAAYNAVISMDNDRAAKVKELGGDDVKAYNTAETKNYFAQVDRYMAKWGKQKEAAELSYNAAVIHYNAKQYKVAIDVLKKLRQDFPKHEYTLIISRMLAQSQLESGSLDDAHKEFEWLLIQYKTVKETKNDSLAIEIDKSIAAVLFQKADKAVKDGKYEEGAKAYLALTERFPSAEFADKAIFEAGAAYESAKKYDLAAETFMLMPRKYAKSTLTIRAILRAANAYKNGQKPRDAARTFLFITANFPKDTMAFNAIAFAATTYDSIPDKKMAAQTYEMAADKYPENPKTAGLLYNACLTYDEAKLTEEAIRCSQRVVKEYKKSSYALDAAFSIPIAYKNAKKWDLAADAYIDFAKNFTEDKEKMIAARFGAAQAYKELKNENKAAEQYQLTLDAYDKYGLQIKNSDPAVPAEASYFLGELEQAKMDPILIKGNQKAKDKLLADLTKILGVAMQHYAKSAAYSSEKWTFKATNKMGQLFVVLSSKIREQELNAKNDAELFAERIGVIQTLPGFYDQSKPIFQKNIELAREQGFYNQDVIEAEEGFIEMFYRSCFNFFEVATAFRESPRPEWDQICAAEELEKEDCDAEREAYDATIEEKAGIAEDGAVPVCATGIKASAHYQIDNQWTKKMQDGIRNVNPDHEALAIKIEKFDPTTLFRDADYFKTKARLEQVQSSKVMSANEQIKVYKEVISDAKSENAKLKAELEKLKARMVPAAGPGSL